MDNLIVLNTQKVRQEIVAQDLKLWWLAEMAGIHRTTLRRWLTGRIARVRIHRVNRLGSVLGVGLSELC